MIELTSTQNQPASVSTKSTPGNAFSFVVNRGPVGQCFQRAVQKDQQNAKLSKFFRWYYRVRPFVPLAVRQLLQRKRNSNMELPDDWFLPLEFLAELSNAIGEKPLHVAHPWPSGFKHAFCLTHDVETAYGVKLIDKMACIEEELGFRSAWNLIPQKYPIDTGLVRDLIDRGFEIGVHGFNHDGRLFESLGTFSRRALEINKAKSRLHAEGFRAPMVHRNLAWIREHLDFEFDASCFDIDPLQAMPGGVGSIWPFMIDQKMVELPYTMPQDHSLFTSLGQEDTRIWEEKFAFIKRNSGLALMLTHPDYMDTPKRLELYRRFLEQVAESNEHWRCLPAEITRWWKTRESFARAWESGEDKEENRVESEFEVRKSILRAENLEVRFEHMS